LGGRFQKISLGWRRHRFQIACVHLMLFFPAHALVDSRAVGGVICRLLSIFPSNEGDDIFIIRMEQSYSTPPAHCFKLKGCGSKKRFLVSSRTISASSERSNRHFVAF
jgi:hypothetical protein